MAALLGLLKAQLRRNFAHVEIHLWRKDPDARARARISQFAQRGRRWRPRTVWGHFQLCAMAVGGKGHAIARMANHAAGQVAERTAAGIPPRANFLQFSGIHRELPTVIRLLENSQ